MNYSLRGTLPIWMAELIEGIGYKPGWSLAIVAFADSQGGDPYSYSIHARCYVEDVKTKNQIELTGPGMTLYKDHWEKLVEPREKFIVDMIFHAIRELEQHEIEEQFTYNGFRVRDPHRMDSERAKLFELALENPVPAREESVSPLAIDYVRLGEIQDIRFEIAGSRQEGLDAGTSGILGKALRWPRKAKAKKSKRAGTIPTSASR